MKKIYNALLGLFTSLTTTFERQEIQDDYNTTMNALSRSTRSGLQDLDGQVVDSDYPLKARLSKAMKGDSAAPNGSVIAGMLNLTNKLVEEKGFIDDIIEKSFSKVVTQAAIDYKSLNILSYITAVTFVNKYMRHYMLAVVAHENVKMGDQKPISSARIAAMFVEDEDNYAAFVALFKTLSMDKKKIVKMLDTLDGIMVDPEVTERSMGLAVNSTDIFRTGFVPTIFNPFYLLGTLKTSYLKGRLDSYKVETETLEGSIVYYKHLSENASPDELAKIKRLLEKFNTRLIKVNAKIKDIEESAND